jgi:hypothetical protein
MIARIRVAAIPRISFTPRVRSRVKSAVRAFPARQNKQSHLRQVQPRLQARPPVKWSAASMDPKPTRLVAQCGSREQHRRQAPANPAPRLMASCWAHSSVKRRLGAVRERRCWCLAYPSCVPHRECAWVVARWWLWRPPRQQHGAATRPDRAGWSSRQCRASSPGATCPCKETVDARARCGDRSDDGAPCAGARPDVEAVPRGDTTHAVGVGTMGAVTAVGLSRKSHLAACPVRR